ncbi:MULTISPECIES: protein-L-isoaspartate O-methyltransferase family protein [Stenotrophomonas]|jgi:protein-L-isoaspartate(D-aspartate) O-methyltransferase|uniref:Protein-L-isoaspartate O-methyltransferase n=2 Tax=Stenotrophomonas TaxID=40323 RepID=A0A498CKX1_9GAMM|nr:MULTISPECIES: protein-L-isoaspartate O-methyltransferase [Stenotrophomonas]MBU2047926.1 protein-L-isoaspartate O-methyltransferase [Gammaproteobacteria bacterium]MCX2920165.1 protein-L-isoaspartate O-methyltransferase [Stenotrophomonas rhizophila]MDX5514230.1 protein-L-isoaspartate O-methyltransferase [Stenotrophomonas sp. RG-453]RLK57200.1 protein-L-isoaspartate(D-aspartate) O-methyltransferase [Stenotrophomonas rhizophila]WIA61763.1 protein-L-isoaspartate O-methyltransferase [Stenotrophom
MTIDYSHARELMVEQQIRPWDVLEIRVLDVLARLPREAFVAESHRALAYADIELPLGNGQKMMKPVIEGRTLQALDLQPGDEVLEIGTGSGYLSACMGELAREVLSLEIDAELATTARARLDAAGLGNNVRIETADALSWDTERRFDAICVTGAVDVIPSRFAQWLRPGGRLFVIRGRSPVMEAVLVKADGTTESLFETDIDYLRGAAPAPQFQL